MATAPALRADSSLAPAISLGSFQFMREMRAGMLDLFERWSQIGGVARFQSPFFVSHLLTSPEAVQHVLQENHKNYSKEVRSSAIMRTALGDGLFLSDGEKWRAQRRAAQPAFHRQRLAEMTSAMVDAVDSMLRRWSDFADSRGQVDLLAESSRLTLDVIGRTLTSQDLLPYAEHTARAMAATFDYFNHSMNHLFSAPLFVPTARNRAFKNALREIHDLVGRIVEQRKRGTPKNDLLSMMIEAYGTDSDAAELRDNIAIFLGAGTETTAVALCWAWHLLSTHPDAHRKLREEVDTVLGSSRPTFEDLPKLTYTRMVVDEGMRLYPPAWVISRTAIGDDEICGFKIGAGTAVFMSPWVTHRSSLYWESPTEFDPERFTKERSEERPDYAYYPFGGGPRMCIGDRFSIMEQTLALAMTAQKFAVHTEHDGTPDPVFSLRPKGGMRATLARS